MQCPCWALRCITCAKLLSWPAAHASTDALPPQVALLLGGACGVMAVMLQRSWADQARLAALLSKRETDLARLVS